MGIVPLIFLIAIGTIVVITMITVNARSKQKKRGSAESR